MILCSKDKDLFPLRQNFLLKYEMRSRNHSAAHYFGYLFGENKNNL